MASEDDGLEKLDYFSLVSKVCTELEAQLGFGDKILAEFITELGRNCDTVEEFDSKLKQNGAEMPDYFVNTLLRIIHAILPPAAKPGKASGQNPASASKITATKQPSSGNLPSSANNFAGISTSVVDQRKEDRHRRGRDRASTLAMAALAFLLSITCSSLRERERKSNRPNYLTRRQRRSLLRLRLPCCAMTVQSQSVYVRYRGELKGFIIDENGLYVLEKA